VRAPPCWPAPCPPPDTRSRSRSRTWGGRRVQGRAGERGGGWIGDWTKGSVSSAELLVCAASACWWSGCLWRARTRRCWSWPADWRPPLVAGSSRSAARPCP
jgi:hypothetical protein